MPSDKHTSRIETLRQRTVELAQLAALGALVCTAPTAAAQTSQKSQPEMKQAETDRPLEAQLKEMSEGFSKRADQATVDLYTQAIENLKESGALDKTLKVGDQAPNFELPNATGETVTLTTLLAEGPVVLTFYRGGWCPYCNIQLRAYQNNIEAFESFGAQLVAISPEKPDNTLSTTEKNELEFAVLSDEQNTVADDFGLRYEIDPALAERFGPMLEQVNGDDSHTLPLTATYIIDTEGVIRYAEVTADYKLRAEPADVIAALKTIN